MGRYRYLPRVLVATQITCSFSLREKTSWFSYLSFPFQSESLMLCLTTMTDHSLIYLLSWQYVLSTYHILRTGLGIGIQEDAFPALRKLPFYWNSPCVPLRIFMKTSWEVSASSLYAINTWWGTSWPVHLFKDQVRCTSVVCILSHGTRLVGASQPLWPGSQGGHTEKFSWNAWKLMTHLEQMEEITVTYSAGDGDIWAGALTIAK